MNLAKQAKQAPNNTANSTSEVQLGATTGIHMNTSKMHRKVCSSQLRYLNLAQPLNLVCHHIFRI